MDGDRQGLFLEPASVALAAGHLDHELLQLHANGVGVRFLIASLDVRQDSFPLDVLTGLQLTLACSPFAFGAIENLVADALGQVAPWSIQVELELTCERRQHDLA